MPREVSFPTETGSDPGGFESMRLTQVKPLRLSYRRPHSARSGRWPGAGVKQTTRAIPARFWPRPCAPV